MLQKNVNVVMPKITAVAKDGIQLLVVTRITVRSNIDRLVGGATEETVVARVGEGIVSTIGSSNNYAEVLENPDRIDSMFIASAATGVDSTLHVLSAEEPLDASVEFGEEALRRLRTNPGTLPPRPAARR